MLFATKMPKRVFFQREENHLVWGRIKKKLVLARYIYSKNLEFGLTQKASSWIETLIKYELRNQRNPNGTQCNAEKIFVR